MMKGLGMYMRKLMRCYLQQWHSLFFYPHPHSTECYLYKSLVYINQEIIWNLFFHHLFFAEALCSPCCPCSGSAQCCEFRWNLSALKRSMWGYFVFICLPVRTLSCILSAHVSDVSVSFSFFVWFGLMFCCFLLFCNIKKERYRLKNCRNI